jgi:hypothetical protein
MKNANPHVENLINAIRPFANLVSESNGRIPVESLSFAHWHALAGAYNAATGAMIWEPDAPAPPPEAKGAATGEPLPCPFCGGKADWYQDGTFLLCRDCEADGPTKGDWYEAVAAWNRRAPVAPPPPQSRDPAPIPKTPLYPVYGMGGGSAAEMRAQDEWTKIYGPPPGDPGSRVWKKGEPLPTEEARQILSETMDQLDPDNDRDAWFAVRLTKALEAMQSPGAGEREGTAGEPRPCPEPPGLRKGPWPGVLDYRREIAAGGILREALEYDPESGRMRVKPSCGELAQRVVRWALGEIAEARREGERAGVERAAKAMRECADGWRTCSPTFREAWLSAASFVEHFDADAGEGNHQHRQTPGKD